MTIKLNTQIPTPPIASSVARTVQPGTTVSSPHGAMPGTEQAAKAKPRGPQPVDLREVSVPDGTGHSTDDEDDEDEAEDR